VYPIRVGMRVLIRKIYDRLTICRVMPTQNEWQESIGLCTISMNIRQNLLGTSAALIRSEGLYDDMSHKDPESLAHRVPHPVGMLFTFLAHGKPAIDLEAGCLVNIGRKWIISLVPGSRPFTNGSMKHSADTVALGTGKQTRTMRKYRIGKVGLNSGAANLQHTRLLCKNDRAV
jgi:hypothetical protein